MMIRLLFRAPPVRGFRAWSTIQNTSHPSPLYRFKKYTIIAGIVAIVVGYNWDSIYWTEKVFLRCSRTIKTAIWIVFDYKWSLRPFTPADRSSDPSSARHQEYLNSKSNAHLRNARRLLKLFCDNGGVYIKLGQHLSSLEYILPIEYCQVMSVLQDAAPQSSLKDINKTFIEDFGVPYHEIFSEFDPLPIGTASLAQVHKATLKNGQPVAVKVQHYNLNDYAHMDISVVAVVIKVVKFLFPEFTLDWLAEEMSSNLPKELNFISEGHNAERLALNFKSDPSVKVPKIYWNYTSHRILTMEYTAGAKINDLKFMKAHNINPIHVYNKLNEIYCKMIFRDGFIHCDPHPGNLFVRLREHDRCYSSTLSFILSRCMDYVRSLFHSTRSPFEIVVLDHGLYKAITDEFRLNYARLWLAIVTGKEKNIREYSLKVGGINAHRLFTCVLTQRSWSSIESGAVRRGLIQTQDELQQIIDKAGDYLVKVAELLEKVPRPLLLIFKTNDLLRSIGRSLQNSYEDLHITSIYEIMAREAIKVLFVQDMKASRTLWEKCYTLSKYTYMQVWLLCLCFYYRIVTIHD